MSCFVWYTAFGVVIFVWCYLKVALSILKKNTQTFLCKMKYSKGNSAMKMSKGGSVAAGFANRRREDLT